MKLLGRSISYNVLNDRLQRLWKPKGDMELIDVGHGFFIVRLEAQEYQKFVM